MARKDHYSEEERERATEEFGAREEKEGGRGLGCGVSEDYVERAKLNKR